RVRWPTATSRRSRGSTSLCTGRAAPARSWRRGPFTRCRLAGCAMSCSGQLGHRRVHTLLEHCSHRNEARVRAQWGEERAALQPAEVEEARGGALFEAGQGRLALVVEGADLGLDLVHEGAAAGGGVVLRDEEGEVDRFNGGARGEDLFEHPSRDGEVALVA